MDFTAFNDKEMATIVLALDRHRNWLVHQAEHQTGAGRDKTLEHAATTEAAVAKIKQVQRERLAS